MVKNNTKHAIIFAFTFFLVISSIYIFYGINSVKETVYENTNIPTYFLEPEGCIIVKIDANDDSWLKDKYYYGYITIESYESFLNGNLTTPLVVKHPYEENKSVIVELDQIQSIQVNIYEDNRK